jgi:multidrug efflux pump subunit AcrA (membrane-fusion protein)
MKILVVGSGGVGAAFAPIAARRDFYEHIVFADYDEARARSVVDRYDAGTGRFSAAQVDASDAAASEAPRLVLRAPFDGRVVDRNVTPGALVEALQPLMTVANLSRVWIFLQAYEKDLALLHDGLHDFPFLARCRHIACQRRSDITQQKSANSCQRVFKTSVNGQEVVTKSRLPLGCANEC